MRLELLLAAPPTRRCKALEEMFKQFVSENPKLKLDIYYAGTACSIPTTRGFKKTINKTIKIPMAFINGKPIPKELHNDIEKIRAILSEEFSKGENNWDD